MIKKKWNEGGRRREKRKGGGEEGEEGGRGETKVLEVTPRTIE